MIGSSVQFHCYCERCGRRWSHVYVATASVLVCPLCGHNDIVWSKDITALVAGR